MFHHEGPARSDRLNRILAAYLAFVAGYVNASGFILVGTFTSHVTGNVGRMAVDLASREPGAAMTAFVMIAAFFVGALFASLTIESNLFARTANAYGAALCMQAVLLLAFSMGAAWVSPSARLRDLHASLLCAAMGMQNSLVTRLSGAVVRTTHLTGVVTDIGIEAARWLRWWKTGTNAGAARVLRQRPAVQTIVLLSTIAGMFTVGAVLGAAATLRWATMAIVPSSVLVAAAGTYAFGTRNARSAA